MRSFKIMFNEFFDRSISTRSAIENIFCFDIADISEVILDFTEINLISASAAHQIIIETRKLEDINIQVNMINLHNHVKRMLELSKTDRKNILTLPHFKRYKLKNSEEINKFLLSFQ